MRELLRFFAGQREVLLAYLFGSYARGEAKSESDVNIAVLLDPGLTYIGTLFLGIRGTIGIERFNLLVLRDHHTRGFIFAKKEGILNRFELDVIRKYQDTAYLREVQNRYLKERVHRWFSEKKASAHG